MWLFNRLRALLHILLLISISVNSFAQLASRKALLNTIEIKMPASFKLMDAAMLANKYPSNNHPTEAYTNDDISINVSFKRTEQILMEQNVFAEGKKMAQQLISKGRVQLISSEDIKSNGNNIHVFSFYSNAIDTKVYNIIFIFSLKGKMVAGSFNCTSDLQNRWQTTAYDIIRSIKKV
jgi:hypothetical protein